MGRDKLKLDNQATGFIEGYYINMQNKQPIFSSFSAKDVEVINKETVYQGYFQIEKYTLRHRLYQGGWSKPFTRELFERGQAVGILLYDPDLQKIVLIEQFRIGALQQTDNPWLVELVAGIIEPGEFMEQVAIRETEEEAGLQISEMIPICDYFASPGGSTEKVTLFCAKVDASVAGGFHGLAEESEDIRVLVFDVHEVYELLATRMFCSAPIIIAVQWLQLHEHEIRQKWIKSA